MKKVCQLTILFFAGILAGVSGTLLALNVLESRSKPKTIGEVKFIKGEHCRRKGVTEASGLRFHGNITDIRQEGSKWTYLILAPDGKRGWWNEEDIEHDERYDQIENWKVRAEALGPEDLQF